MGNFLTLVSIENIKLWKRLSTKVMLVIMIVMVIAVQGIFKFYNVSNKVSNNVGVSENWKDDLQKELTVQKDQLKQTKENTNKMVTATIGFSEKRIAELEYRINNDIKPEAKQSIWANVTSFNSNFASLVTLLIIITCAATVAGEFSEGTMKMMISRPYKRHEILSAKLVVTIFYGILLLLTTFLLNFLLMGILYGFEGLGAKEMFWTSSKILYIPAALKTFIVLGFDFLTVLVFLIVAFAISAIVRSRSMATGFSLFLLLAGTNIIQILAMYFSWGKYLPFGLSGFSTFINQGSYIIGTTLTFALISAGIYSIVFIFLGYFVFQKRDI